jgi:hypothetical protein
MNIDDDLPPLPLREWVVLDRILPALRHRYAVNNGASFISQHWDCKYLNLRLDMRTGQCYITPGNPSLVPGPTSSGEALEKLTEERELLIKLLRERGGHNTSCPSLFGRDCYCGWEEFIKSGKLEYLSPSKG